MDYTEAIIWYTAWPVLIFIAYKFVMLNLRHHAKMERLEMLEERFGEQFPHTDALLKNRPKSQE
ncbi:MAG: hypothetical protein DSZ05_08365 [Sulfurospirillum sp.]|nr:MAG: hypothetical protein DSZ05_08365 [Sulfurospirillum sp.]